jgi:signal transduction histidine kinase
MDTADWKILKLEKDAHSPSSFFTGAEACTPLTAELLQKLEADHQRYAHRLGDKVTQPVLSVRLQLQNLLHQHARELSPSAINTLMTANQQLKDALAAIKHIELDLHPRMLDDLGLKPSIEWLLRQYEELSQGWTVQSAIALPEVPLERTLKLAVFRVVQEALSNIYRHARADRVMLCLESQFGRLRLVVMDNGSGIARELTDSGAVGLGLACMQARVRATGGELKISSQPGQGTYLHASWPLPLLKADAQPVDMLWGDERLR